MTTESEPATCTIKPCLCLHAVGGRREKEGVSTTDRTAEGGTVTTGTAENNGKVQCLNQTVLLPIILTVPPSCEYSHTAGGDACLLVCHPQSHAVVTAPTGAAVRRQEQVITESGDRVREFTGQCTAGPTAVYQRLVFQ